MKIHRLLAEASAGILRDVFRHSKVLDRCIAEAFSAQPRWGKRDRAFIAETVFEVTRWKRSLEFIANSNEHRALCAAQWTRMGYEIPSWWRYSGESPAGMRAREMQLADQPRAIRESIPDWLDELGQSELGDAWETEIHALNTRAPVFLRVNTLMTTPEQAIPWLEENQVTASPVAGTPNALALPVGKLLPKPIRNDGRIEIQDAGSQNIASMLDLQPGQRVIDACAGAGGKTLQLAAILQNRGRIYAMDVDPQKLAELKIRARRARATCITTRSIVDTTPDDFKYFADRLLIDAPCSGLGTLRRQPDLKWRLKPSQWNRIRRIQRDLLHRYSLMVKPDGLMVYATCSILPSENHGTVESLLDRGCWKLIAEKKISPASTGFDGFYAATLVRERE